VLCHPTKWEKEVENLKPRGGGAFIAEMDGNLTLRRTSDHTVELSWNKIRGPGFDPINFRLDKITAPRLVDSKGKPLWTVRAAAISDTDLEVEAGKTKSNENDVLALYLREPEISMAEVAKRLGWGSKARVHRAVEALERSKLMHNDRGDWSVTEKGKVIARKHVLGTERHETERETRIVS
jgi:DNA-binding MarR family transcriptional regulator